MINDYSQFADAMDLKSGDVNRCIDDLAELKEVSPAVFDMYDREYQKQKQARQAKAKQKQEGRKNQMYMSYDEFVKLFESMGETSLMHTDKQSPLQRMSQFSRQEPRLYQEYRARMHNEDSKERRFRG